MNVLGQKEIQDFRLFACELVQNMGKILLSRREKNSIVTYKDNQDICTQADLASETYCIDAIRSRYPIHNVLSEEKGEIVGDSDFRWLIDPLDGTKEFVRNLPLYNCSVALEYKEELVASAIYRPEERVLYSAGKGMGAFKGNKKIHICDTLSIGDSFVYCYLPSFVSNKDNAELSWKKLSMVGKSAYRMRSLSDANTALCWVAQGGCEAYIDLKTDSKLWDILPGLFIAIEAGARVTDERGEEIIHNDLSHGVVVSNGLVHNVLINLLKGMN